MSTFNSDDLTTRASAEIRSPSLSSTMSPGTSRRRGCSTSALPPHHRSLGQQGRKRPDRPLGPVLLDEAEGTVDKDHHNDGDAELRQAPDEGQAGSNPEHQGEEMDELLDESPGERWSPRPGEPIGANVFQPVGGLRIGQAASSGDELGESILL